MVLPPPPTVKPLKAYRDNKQGHLSAECKKSKYVCHSRQIIDMQKKKIFFSKSIPPLFFCRVFKIANEVNYTEDERFRAFHADALQQHTVKLPYITAMLTHKPMVQCVAMPFILNSTPTQYYDIVQGTCIAALHSAHAHLGAV